MTKRPNEEDARMEPNKQHGAGVSESSDRPMATREGAQFTRPGDPSEFDDEATSVVADSDGGGKLVVPPGLVRRLLADPMHAPEILAARAVEQFADRAARDVRLLRERNPEATDRELALHFRRKYSRAARWEGGGSGVAGLLGLPADLVLLAWIQNRLVLSVAAAYGHDMSDHTERAVELLMIQGIHNSREVARRALVAQAQKAVRKLVLRHLRKQSLLLVKRLFGVVGINFTRKALLEKGVPLLSVPISAAVNDASTRLVANQAIKFYDMEIKTK